MNRPSSSRFGTPPRPPSGASRRVSLCLVLALGLAVGACGQRGPLYLPDDAAGNDATEQSQDDSSTSGEQSPEQADQDDEETP